MFWMVWNDFVTYFNKVYICRTFADHMQLMVQGDCCIIFIHFHLYPSLGEWIGDSAAGAHKLQIDRDGENRAEAEGGQTRARLPPTGHITRMDGDPSWFNNPQYVCAASCACEQTDSHECAQRLEPNGDAKVYISLLQSDRKLNGRTENHAIRYPCHTHTFTHTYALHCIFPPGLRVDAKGVE